MLGIKTFKPHRTLGVKHHKIKLALGNKYFHNINNESNHIMAHSKDGIIYNNHNSVDVQREPMKHTEFKPKNYTKDIRHSRIEKARRRDNEGGYDKKFA